MKNRFAPIAVIDSGLGGVSVLAELVDIMPCEDYIFFGDSKNAPYGTKTRDEVREIMHRNTDTLIKMGAKAIVVACNTATSAAVRSMRERLPNLPIVGIEPAIKPALEICEHPTVAVMATPLTLAEEKFKLLKARFSESEDIIELPCPGLMELVEAGDTGKASVKDYIERLFEPLKDTHIDAVVLGCTHYSFIKRELYEYFGGNVAVLDGALGTAREAKRRICAAMLETTSNERGKIRFINTDGDKEKETSYAEFLRRYTEIKSIPTQN